MVWQIFGKELQGITGGQSLREFYAPLRDIFSAPERGKFGIRTPNSEFGFENAIS